MHTYQGRITIPQFQALCDNLRKAGKNTDGVAFLEGFLHAYNFPNATIARIKANVRNDIQSGIYVSNKLFYLNTTESNLYSDFQILQRNNLNRIHARFIGYSANSIEYKV